MTRTRRGFRWHTANRQQRAVVEQNLPPKLKSIFGPKVKVRPAIPELKLPQPSKKK